MLKVIDGKQLKIKEKPGYYSGGLTEEDYLRFVQESQPYFIAGDFEDRTTRVYGKSAYAIWVDPCRAVVVEHVGRNKYEVTNNGHHRAYIAKKYKLKLLVYIDDDLLPDNYPLF